MLGTMAEPKKPRRLPSLPTPAEPSPQSEEKGQRSGKALNVWIDDDIYTAFENFRKSQLAEPTKTSVVEAALKEFLRKHGHYPLNSGE